MMRASLTLAVILVSALPAGAQMTWDFPSPEPVPYHVDTGWLTNSARLAQVVHEETVHFDSAGWIRLYFGDVVLGQGSFLRITSELDGEVQELDGAGLAMWGNTSAYFNGDTLRVELIAGPGTNNQMVIDQAAWEIQPAIPSTGCDPGCCGPTDDRVPSNEDWASRLLPAGCTASIYNTDSCAVSAGHCASGGMVMEFKVPLSNPNCSLNHPPITEQFPVTSFSFTNGGVGNDWLAMTVGTNNLGEQPFQRYGQFRPIASSQPQVGDLAGVWGYGVDDECPFSQAQQTSDGDIAQVTSTLIRYFIDVTFGNSGSSVVRDGTEIVGIVTHCCCPNQGTNIFHPSFVAARESLCPTSPAQSAPLLSASVLMGTLVSGSVSQLAASDGDFFVVDSATAGPRNNAMTEVVAQSPFTTVNELNLTVEYGPADASPVFLLVQLFNDDAGSWDNMQFGIASTANATVVTLESIPNPNSYVNASGEVKIRVSQTARLPQTPDGFTKLIDHVGVTVRP